MKRTFAPEHGVGHVAAIAIIAVVAAVGIGGWYVYRQNSDSAPANANTKAIREALKNVRCGLDDEDLCKFFTSWKASRYYSADMTVKTGSTTNTTTIRVDGDRMHTKIDAELSQETITIGKTLYTKDTERNMWYKQTTQSIGSSFFDFTESKAAEGSQAVRDKANYKKIGKEGCGQLTCFKYQVVNPEDQGTKTFIWFDDKDYQLRKQTVENTSSRMTTTFTYDRVTINEPSPYRELSENEVYIPGQGVINTGSGPGFDTQRLNELLQQSQQ